MKKPSSKNARFVQGILFSPSGVLSELVVTKKGVIYSKKKFVNKNKKT